MYFSLQSILHSFQILFTFDPHATNYQSRPYIIYNWKGLSVIFFSLGSTVFWFCSFLIYFFPAWGFAGNVGEMCAASLLFFEAIFLALDTFTCEVFKKIFQIDLEENSMIFMKFMELEFRKQLDERDPLNKNSKLSEMTDDASDTIISLSEKE
eukprot:TRINITY_DN8680_c0_g1_i2.p1 TRINITY_DN8680_c0_g1~~TRINITY_DN8680_c0_g1_i2.p1  ORF type:complete len:153 (+),score=32.99 TRINITY_DN8680_c0_g1_i2:380-838(+)